MSLIMHRGVTLLELLIVLGLLVLLSAIGVPSFCSARQEHQLLAVAHTLRGDIQRARVEASHRPLASMAIHFFADGASGWCYRLSDRPDSQCHSCGDLCDLGGDGQRRGADGNAFPGVTLSEIAYLGEELGIGSRHGTLSPGHILLRSGSLQLKVITSGLGRVRFCSMGGQLAGVSPCL